MGNYYFIRRFLAVLPASLEPFRTYILIAMAAAAIAYIAAKMYLVKYSNTFYDIVLWIGSLWFAVLLYSLLFLIAIDLYKFARWILRYLCQSQFQFPTAYTGKCNICLVDSNCYRSNSLRFFQCTEHKDKVYKS
jgi:hypothetical protein